MNLTQARSLRTELLSVSPPQGLLALSCVFLYMQTSADFFCENSTARFLEDKTGGNTGMSLSVSWKRVHNPPLEQVGNRDTHSDSSAVSFTYVFLLVK